MNGIINTMVLEKKIPSHQEPDAKTVVLELDVVTMAVSAPGEMELADIADVVGDYRLRKAQSRGCSRVRCARRKTRRDAAEHNP